MKRLCTIYLALAILFVSLNSGCQAGRFGGGQFGAPGNGIFQQQSVQGVQNFGQDVGRRFANGFFNRAIGTVVNYAWQAVGL